MNNLDMSLESNRVWNSIIDFKGEFDGKNHTISGFYMDTSIEKSGFFGINYGKIKEPKYLCKLNEKCYPF